MKRQSQNIEAKPEVGNMSSIFIDNEHQDFFGKMQSQTGNTDVYHRALFYTIGLSRDTRDHYHRIYDIKNREIRTECLIEGWQTHTTKRICHLAFNLFNGYVDHEDPRASTPEDLFACSLAHYFAIAIAIRYPEYH